MKSMLPVVSMQVLDPESLAAVEESFPEKPEGVLDRGAGMKTGMALSRQANRR
jgi:hypothetical protein